MDKDGRMNARLSDQVSTQLGRYYLDEAGLQRFIGCIHLARELAESTNLHTRPFLAQGVAHLMREALGEISTAIPDPLDGQWSRVSRSVVDAKTRLDAAPPDQQKDAIGELLATVDDLQAFHSGQSRKHERGLVNLVSATTGATVMPDTAREFGLLVSKLSRAAHGSQPLDHVISLQEHAIAVLELVFGHPESRTTRLDELAVLERPTVEHAQEVNTLVTTDYELRSFLSSVPNSRWLLVLEHADLLRPPKERSLWPVIMLCERLRTADAAPIAGWLKQALARWGDDPGSAEAIASAGRALGDYGQPTLLKALARHPDSQSIRRDLRFAVQRTSPDSAFVMQAFLALGRDS